MTKSQILSSRNVLMALVAVGALSLTGQDSQAATTDGTAGAEIKQALTITENTPLHFGTINAPSANSNTYDVATDGTLTETGTGDGFHAGDQTVGAWTVNGEVSRTVSVSASIGTWSDAGITTDSTYVNGSTSTTTATLDATTGDATLSIAGKITVDSTVTPGSHSATLTVTADYQ